jgi:hypothetical protein
MLVLSLHPFEDLVLFVAFVADPLPQNILLFAHQSNTRTFAAEGLFTNAALMALVKNGYEFLAAPKAALRLLVSISAVACTLTLLVP